MIFNKKINIVSLLSNQFHQIFHQLANTIKLRNSTFTHLTSAHILDSINNKHCQYFDKHAAPRTPSWMIKNH